MILCVYIGRETGDKIKNDFFKPSSRIVFLWILHLIIKRFSGNYEIVDLLGIFASDSKKLTRVHCYN